MNHCKFGIISQSYNNPKCFLIIAMVKKINKKYLKKLDKYLEYLTPFIVKIKNGNICIENIQDLTTFLDYFDIKINIELKIDEKVQTYKFRTPILYDLTNNYKVFDKSLLKYTLKFDTKVYDINKIFILLPINNVILRGKILENCRYSFFNSNIHFITIGGKQRLNTQKTSILNKRYLLTLGVNSDIIYICNCSDEFPDLIIDIIEFTKLLNIFNFELIFLLPKILSKQLLSCSRSLKMCNVIHEKTKISFICEL